jgi:hypothetical protein
VTIRLHGHHISFDPPQHVATLAVERQTDGRLLELMPAGGEESEDGVAVLEPLPSSAESATTRENYVGPGIKSDYLVRLPLVKEIDLLNLPSDYKRTSISNVDHFNFVPGERYAVTLVSELILQAIVVVEQDATFTAS